MSFIAGLLAKIGASSAAAGTQGCWYWFMEEPKMPKSLIEK